MFDMRCEEEAAVLPHSRARQEQLQLINNQLREEDDKWQDVSSGQGRGAVGREAADPPDWERVTWTSKSCWRGQPQHDRQRPVPV